MPNEAPCTHKPIGAMVDIPISARSKPKAMNGILFSTCHCVNSQQLINDPLFCIFTLYYSTLIDLNIEADIAFVVRDMLLLSPGKFFTVREL